MSYYINLESISINAYKSKLMETDLLPSRTILKENLEERFEFFKNYGLKNVKQLQSALKGKKSFADFEKVKIFDSEYLSILLREINSIQPKPVKIADFDDISPSSIEKLQQIGIKDTVGLYEHILTPEQRTELSSKTNVTLPEIVQLSKLCDLVRIKWVGATFAKVLYKTGFDTAEKVSKANFEDLYNTVKQVNLENKLFKGNIGINDIKLCINAAKEISFDIKY